MKKPATVAIPVNPKLLRAPPVPAPIDPLLLDLIEAKELAGITLWQLRGLIARQEIKIVNVGGKFYIRRATLLRWMEHAEELHLTP